MDGLLQRLQSQRAAPARALTGVPRVFEESLGMPAFDPSAGFTGDEVSPTKFKPGANIDIDIEYWAKNPDAWWNTCIVVTRLDTGVVYHKTHGMISHDDDYIVEPLVCGKMPEEEIEMVVEIWGHPDFYSSWP